MEGRYQVLHTSDALEDNVGLLVRCTMVHDARAIDQEDALHEGDVLPHFGLPGDWRDLAHLHPAPQSTAWSKMLAFNSPGSLCLDSASISHHKSTCHQKSACRQKRRRAVMIRVCQFVETI